MGHGSSGASGHRSILAVALALLGSIAALSATACSVIVDTNDNQCTTDADCERFGNYPACVEGACVPADRHPAGCYPKEPTETTQFINRCTDAECVPYDNCARLGLCGGAKLPPASPPPPEAQ